MFKKIAIFSFLSLFVVQFLFSQNSVIPTEEKDSSLLMTDQDEKNQDQDPETVKKEKAKQKAFSENRVLAKNEKNTGFPFVIFNMNNQGETFQNRTKSEIPTASIALSKDTNTLASSVQEKAISEKDGIHSSLNYFEVGMGPFPLPLPAFGMGVRQQTGHHGSDFSLRVATLVYITQVNADLLYHYYPKPNLESQFYMGTGLGTSGLFGSHFGYHRKSARFLLGPELVLGRQFKTKTQDARFIQMKVNWPVFVPSSHHDKVIYFPFTVFSYGYCF